MNLEQFYIDAEAQYEACAADYGEYFWDNYPYDQFLFEMDKYVLMTEGDDYTRAYELITRSINSASDMAAQDQETAGVYDYEPGMDGEGSYWPR